MSDQYSGTMMDTILEICRLSELACGVKPEDVERRHAERTREMEERMEGK